MVNAIRIEESCQAIISTHWTPQSGTFWEVRLAITRAKLIERQFPIITTKTISIAFIKTSLTKQCGSINRMKSLFWMEYKFVSPISFKITIPRETGGPNIRKTRVRKSTNCSKSINRKW
jgi:hypothetical protein